MRLLALLDVETCHRMHVYNSKIGACANSGYQALFFPHPKKKKKKKKRKKEAGFKAKWIPGSLFPPRPPKERLGSRLEVAVVVLA